MTKHRMLGIAVPKNLQNIVFSGMIKFMKIHTVMEKAYERQEGRLHRNNTTTLMTDSIQIIRVHKRRA